MFEVAILGTHLLHSKVTVTGSVGETLSSLGLFLLLGGPHSSRLGKSVLMPPYFFLFVSVVGALLSQCHLLPGPSAPVLTPPYHTLSAAFLLGLRVESLIPPSPAFTVNMEECITGGLVVCWELEKPQKGTGSPSVTIGSG